MTNTILFVYFLGLNAIAGVLFSYDKQAAVRNKFRIPEKVLHLFEIAGGIFSILFLMYSISHKNKKFSYFFISWIILAAWILLIYFVTKNHII